MKPGDIKYRIAALLKTDRMLVRYKNSDYVVQLKVRFMYYLILGFICSLLILIPLTALIQYTNPIKHAIYWPVIYTESALFIALCLSLYLVVRGWFKIVSHVILVLVFTTIWIVIFIDKSNTITRLDTIVYVLVILSTTPILLSGKKHLILLYTLANLLVLFVFSTVFNKTFDGSVSTIFDFILDTSIAIVFIGLVAFNIFSINKTALDKANSDIKARKEAEKLLASSEKKYREMTELLPQTVFESDMSGKLTYVNKFGLEKYGYTPADVQFGYNIVDTLLPSDVPKAKENIGKLIQSGVPQVNQYVVTKKDGSTFPAQINTSLITENNIAIGIRGIAVDITEIVKAEKEIKESRDQFQSLVENIPGITYRCLHDSNWTMQFMSSEIDKLSGYPSSDFIHNKVRTYASVIYHEDSQYVATVVENSIQSGNHWELEYRIVHRDGSIKWAYEKGRGVKNSDGNIEYIDGFILDITKRKTAELALIESESRFKHLFMSAPIAFSSLNMSGEITMVNQALKDILGYTIEDIPTINDWWQKAYPDEAYRSEVLVSWGDKIQEAVANKTLVEPEEYMVTDKWGKEHVMLVSASVYSDYILASFMDITERKTAEKKLLQSEERFKAMIEFLPYSVLVVDYEGRHRIVNEAYCKELGCSKEEAIGKTPYELGYLVDENTQKVVRELLEKVGYVENIETTVTRKDKSTGHMYFSSRIVNLNEQPVILSSSIDITEKKKIEKELEKYRKDLEILVKERTEELALANQELSAANEEYQAINEELYDKNQIINNQNKELSAAMQHLKETQTQLVQAEKMASLGILTAGVAHEINNPLNFIMGGYVGFENYFNQTNQHSKKLSILMNSIKTGIDRASTIVASLNQFSRSNESLDEKCDIHSIISNCIVMLNNRIKYRITVVEDFETEPFVLMGNVGKLHQVFLNILNNSIQAIIEKGDISISTKKQLKNLIITISDTGCGISDENLKKVTDPFFTTKRPGEGTGLGLTISYNIIREHNGKLEIHSEINKGTIVAVTLPLVS
jgi:PAS domain S-box-containing protein